MFDSIKAHTPVSAHVDIAPQPSVMGEALKTAGDHFFVKAEEIPVVAVAIVEASVAPVAVVEVKKISKAQQIKDLIRAKIDAQQEVKVGEIAKAIGVKYQYVYAILHPEVSEKARQKQVDKKKAERELAKAAKVAGAVVNPAT
jgi:hypothetical protein